MIPIYTNYKHNQQRAINMFTCIAMHSNKCMNIKEFISCGINIQYNPNNTKKFKQNLSDIISERFFL